MSSTLVETLAVQPPHTLYVETKSVQLSSQEKLAAQLAHLASQHHTSEYNRSKFGPRGAPATYVPMSITMPHHVKDLRDRQVNSVITGSWWLSEKHPPKPPTKISSGSDPQIIVPFDNIDLKQELCAAIDSPLPTYLASNFPLKTSETHPINTSIMIPFELLPIVSSHLYPVQKPSPTLYDVPPSYHLDKLTSYQYPTQATPLVPKSILRATSLNPPLYPPLVWNRLAVSQAIQVAVSTRFKGAFRSRSSPLSKTSSAPSLISTGLQPSLVTPDDKKSDVLKQLSITPPKARKPLKRIGNLYLSSCPGKKVRLTGPIKGRSGVHRDLERDLTRIKTLGVGCIVCCLDNNELEYLGVSWSDYSRVAYEKGIDVLRIPIPEGLAPESPASLDASLIRLIESYTLQGISILVHCRGGVGRAGIIACCWVLKLGLCGWIDTQISSTSTNETMLESPLGLLRRDTTQLVERIITVVRRRRSAKAIETFEQVLFLVEFVEYLRNRGSDVSSRSVSSVTNLLGREDLGSG